MRTIINCFFAAILLASCGNKDNASSSPGASGTNLNIQGTWRLLTGTLVDRGVTTTTDYTRNKSFIKIINADHFAFLQHDLNKGKDSASFIAGGGRYDLKDSTYTEHLEYCNDRKWEGNDFTFTLTIHNDTLISSGREKAESAGVDRLNTETYVRMK